MILVTGGTGLLGSFIVRELQRRGHSVRVTARQSSLDKARALGVEVFEADLSDTLGLGHAMQGVDGVIHAAWDYENRPANISAMESLLNNWHRGAFVFISTVSVYGISQWVPTTEGHPRNEKSAYGLGKIRCEDLLTLYAQQHQLDFSILRPPHIWGPDPRALRIEATLTSGLYTKIREGKPVILPGETETMWSGFGDDWVDARELAWAAVECLTHPLGTAANVINSHFSWHEFCTELIRLTGSSSRLEHKALDTIVEEELRNKAFFAQNWRYSGQLLAQKLGFTPRYSWQDTLAQIVGMDR